MQYEGLICADALAWLEGRSDVGSVVTSLPDAEEIGADPDAWRAWFLRAAVLCFRAASSDAPVLFYQTDRKAGGGIESKAALVLQSASECDARPLWHKIVLRRTVGAVDLHRPGFTHMIAFGRGARPGKATPDGIEGGPMLYPNAMGLKAASFAVRFAGQSSSRIGAPFCGRETRRSPTL